MQYAKRLPLLPGRIIDCIRTKCPKESDFRYQLAIVAILKNEGDYIEEWIRYHKLVGVDRFIIYDNDSSDNMPDILKRYAETGDVVYQSFHGTGRQLDAYNDAVLKYKEECRYMAFIDGDEYLYPMDREKKIPEIIDDILLLKPKAVAVAVNWRMFGSSHLEKKPQKGGVIDNFLYRATENGKGNECIKTIANPRYIYSYNHPHYPIYRLGYFAVDETGHKVSMWKNVLERTEKIRINHYFTKSKEEWVTRRSMGRGAARKDPDKYKRSIEEFYEHDNNDIYDDGMLFYSDLLNKDVFR